MKWNGEIVAARGDQNNGQKADHVGKQSSAHIHLGADVMWGRNSSPHI